MRCWISSIWSGPQFANAIETLRSLAGEDALPRLVSCLASEGTWRDCLRDLTGLQPKQFESRALIDALAVIGTLAGDRVSRYESARALLRDGDPAGALAEFESLLESEKGPFDREARLGSARALVLLDRPEEALDQTEALLQMGDYGPDLGMQTLTLEADLGRPITHPDPASPGLALAGFTERVVAGRVQVFGETEMAYLDSLEAGVVEERLRHLFHHDVPVVFVTKEL